MMHCIYDLLCQLSTINKNKLSIKHEGSSVLSVAMAGNLINVYVLHQADSGLSYNSLASFSVERKSFVMYLLS